jgi:hypothetical protein
MLTQLVIGFVTDLVVGSLLPPRVAFEDEMNRYLRARGFAAGSRSSSTQNR